MVLVFPFPFFACSSSRKVGLVLAALGMSKVGSIILVNGQAESALEASNVVFEEVGVFFEVDSLKGEFAQSLATVCIGCGAVGDTTTTELGASSVLLGVS